MAKCRAAPSVLCRCTGEPNSSWPNRANDAGRIAEAVLDVTDPEPLPPSHPLWSHERVRITPHIASMTQHGSAARVVIDNLRRFARGDALIGLVDREVLKCRRSAFG